ncbi:hypothetical protein F511_13527 [Dorcoceras hygrometricum]|uniref:3-oxo-5-alpha-steroid 4-dehydrogenase C-terminal domain-containing protein n=1 Tax=Dorcoceras hygrometricum TaxID=472368 RepID=A0A2Z7BC36_9LAMI|nr:hypothetical protein F511_13527 [Dorcoceras hygrometricum]
MVFSVVVKFIHPAAASLVVTAISGISFLSMSNAGYMEIKGKHIKYSKMWSQADEEQSKIPSKRGMFIAYTPAFLAGFASLFLLRHGDFRFTLLRFCVATHFFKRLLEVVFIHKYSGWMDTQAAITISLSYCLSAATLIYAQYLTLGLPEPEFDLKYVGVLLFLVGICGNFYHHYLLSKLRSEGEKQYKIPRGGLFNKVICPHYLFEIVGFLGISCISQTLYSYSLASGTSFYLVGRSYATRKWYESKFHEDFPKDVKALVPYIF